MSGLLQHLSQILLVHPLVSETGAGIVVRTLSERERQSVCMKERGRIETAQVAVRSLLREDWKVIEWS